MHYKCILCITNVVFELQNCLLHCYNGQYAVQLSVMPYAVHIYYMYSKGCLCFTNVLYLSNMHYISLKLSSARFLPKALNNDGDMLVNV